MKIGALITRRDVIVKIGTFTFHSYSVLWISQLQSVINWLSDSEAETKEYM